ncbi:23915_t:CDS:2 [Gigaspora margarita]|uniref:23915_t:CDS:1 n=1 Tax=Gigaspora margarita TaxID=4874 RepID=A0ABN7UXQ2_GIGMA|nr:23915_t:CDS:2 [Gigaspora margarita]
MLDLKRLDEILNINSVQSNFVKREGNVFEEIEVDKDEVFVRNKRSLLEKNDFVVLENSDKENEIQPISTADKASTALEGVKVYTLQSTIPDQR